MATRQAGYAPVSVENFGGLLLNADPGQVGLERAVALDNVDLSVPGIVRTRGGFVKLSGSQTNGTVMAGMHRTMLAAANQFATVTSNGSGTWYLDSYPQSGVRQTIANWAGASALTVLPTFVDIGTPTATYLFVSTPGATLRRVTTSGPSVAASVGQPYFVAATPWDNRLVQAGFSAAANSPTGANGSEYTVFFSDAGAPETFGANNYLHLQPGDSDPLKGMVTWRDLLFIAKTRSLIVFYGTSTDATGNPIFNYRRISLERPLAGTLSTISRRRMTVGTKGVYLLCADGVWLTTGGQPVKVSDDLNPYFDDAVTYIGGTPYSANITAAAGYVFVAVGNGILLVLDERTGQWTVWSPPTGTSIVADICEWGDTSITFEPRSIFYLRARDVWYSDAGVTTDEDSAGFASYYQSGFSDLGQPVEKVIRAVQVTGTGTPTLQMASDFGAVDTGSALTLGTSPAIAEAPQRIARRGTTFSFRLSATTGQWQANSVDLLVRDQRPAGLAA